MSIRIGIGPSFGALPTVEQYWSWVQLCEASRIDSLWHSDQLLGPTLEPMSMLAALAAATRRLRFGTNVVVVSLRDPLLLAKQCATIDFLSRGRLLPVFGVGNATDKVWAATGRSSNGRGQRSNEAITLVRRLLSEERVSFRGDYFIYENAQLMPRPAHRIPLWIGGDSAAAIRRTAALGDGWLGGVTSPARAGAIVARIKAALLETGRTIEEDHYGVVIPFRFGSLADRSVVEFRDRFSARAAADEAPWSTLAVGDAATIIGAFQNYVAAGISKFVAIPISDSADDMLAQTRLLASEIVPTVEA